MKSTQKKKANGSRIIKKFEKVLYGLVFGALIIIAVIVAMSAVKIPGNYKLLVVQSGSMEPAVQRGAVAVVKPQKEYKVQDVVTVRESVSSKVSVTHRIVKIEKKDGNTFFITKGDSNNSPDTEKRPEQNVTGRLLFSIPYAGYVVDFAKTKTGLLLLILLPCALIIFSEILNIKKELSGFKKKYV